MSEWLQHSVVAHYNSERVGIGIVGLIQSREDDMGLFSGFFGGGSSNRKSSSGCKIYPTKGGPKITQCKDGSKTFTHSSSTKKGAKTTSYKYKK